MNQKILIIKSGYSEFLFNKDSEKPSLGDILRITPILYLFKEDNVTWVTDKEAFPLLEGNPYINRLLALDFSTAMNLLDEDFDIVINLEKNHDICKLANRINAWKKYGFRFDKIKNRVEAYDRASEVLAYGSNVKLKRETNKVAQELLFEIIGEKWKEQEYVLGYKPNKQIYTYNIALNTKVGAKFPNKAWPERYWDILEKMLKDKGFTVTRQDKQSSDILSNLHSYMDWLNSCKMIVTNDSLGLHLGIALKKKVIGLFGPTKPGEVYFYGRGKAVTPSSSLTCVPCLDDEGKCSTGKDCMKRIQPETVYKEILREMKK
jgi:heptosyltransferase-2